MATQHSPLSVSETASCSTPGYPVELRKRKRSGSESQPAREYGLMRDTGEHDVARFVGSGSGIHYIRAVYLRLARRSATRSTQTTAINTLVPGEDDQLRQSALDMSTREKLLWNSNEVLSSQETVNLQPSFEDFVEWSRSFFESWHPALPFLHGPDILRIFEDASNRGASSISHLDYVILRSILSIALADSRQGSPLPKPIPSHLVFQSVEEAVTVSQFALSQPASIRSTQAALAIQLFLTSMLCLNAASRLGGLIVRMAFHLGLHRCPTRFPFFTPEEASLRRRVLWCIYILERLLCQSLGLPLDIRDDDLDVCYPGEERHGGSSDTVGGIERLQLLNYLAKHARIRGLILELRNKNIPQRQDSADRTTFVQTELAKWSNDIQDIVEEEEEGDPSSDAEAQNSPRLSPSHCLMLLVLKHESTICLNRPGLASGPSSPSYSSAFQECIFAAKSICILLKRHRKRYKLKGDGFEKRLVSPLLWPSFTWAVWISAFVLIHAAIESQVPLNSSLRHVLSGKEMLSHLATRDTSWPEYCLEAVDEMISTVQELSRSPATIRDSSPGPLISTHDSSQGQHLGHGTTSTPSTRRDTSLNGRTDAGGVEADGAVFPSSQPNISTLIGHVDSADAVQVHNVAPSLRDGGSLHSDPLPQRTPSRAGTNVSYGVVGAAGTAANRPDSTNPQSTTTLATVPEGIDTSINPGPVEGQESMMWYDQLFASSFSAIDNPFLVAAEFDASIDPTWDYLR